MNISQLLDKHGYALWKCVFGFHRWIKMNPAIPLLRCNRCHKLMFEQDQ